MSTACDHWLTSKVRTLQLTLDESTSSELVRLEEKLNDHNPESTMFSKAKSSDVSEELFAVVGRWRASADIVVGSIGLLTEEEQDLLRLFFKEQSGLLR